MTECERRPSVTWGGVAVTARSIIAKGCIHPSRPLAASARLVRASASEQHEEVEDTDETERPLASTTVVRWTVADE
jgi:hypothetical protein